jgi:hypothetical protein
MIMHHYTFEKGRSSVFGVFKSWDVLRENWILRNFNNLRFSIETQNEECTQPN